MAHDAVRRAASRAPPPRRGASSSSSRRVAADTAGKMASHRPAGRGRRRPPPASGVARGVEHGVGFAEARGRGDDGRIDLNAVETDEKHRFARTEERRTRRAAWGDAGRAREERILGLVGELSEERVVRNYDDEIAAMLGQVGGAATGGASRARPTPTSSCCSSCMNVKHKSIGMRAQLSAVADVPGTSTT